MARKLPIFALLGGMLMLQGCLSTVGTIVTAPVKVASKAADLATTSQSEADENRGRALRQREERLGKLEREYNKEAKRCEDGDARACDKRDDIAAEIQELLPTIPARYPD